MLRITDMCRLLPPLLMLMLSYFTFQETQAKSVKAAEKTGNFMDDEQWLSTISQYSRKLKHWNRFRDVSPPGVDGEDAGHCGRVDALTQRL